jgi:hypothetical protein
MAANYLRCLPHLDEGGDAGDGRKGHSSDALAATHFILRSNHRAKAAQAQAIGEHE